jgi:hypothetical protein
MDTSYGVSSGRDSAWVGLWPRWLLCACAIVLTIPIWLVDMPAMPDYPAHLATFYLIAEGGKSGLLAQFYHVHWAAVPNLASEVLVPLLARIVTLATATKIFLSLVVLMWVLGAGAVHKALYGRMGLAPVFGGLFAYNANFMWGFFNFCFATGLAFLVFAAWIADTRRRSPWHLAAYAAAILLIYFAHVFAAALLLLLLGCLEFSALPLPLSLSALASRTVPIVAVATPAVAAFLLRPHGAGGAVTFNLLDTIDDRLSAALQFTFDRPAYEVLAFVVVLLGAGLWRKRIVLDRRLKWPLIVLLIACIFAPEWAMGGWGVDLRLPAVLGALTFAAADFRFAWRTTAALACVAALLVSYQSATLAGNWIYYDRRFVEFRAASADIPMGSKVLTVLDGDSIGLAADQPYWHMAEYSIIDRAAFTPLLFATKGQHVIQLQPQVVPIAAHTAQQGSPPDISELDDLAAGDIDGDTDIRDVFPYLMRFQCHFDIAVVVHLAGHRSPVPAMLTLLHPGSFFSLYRIRAGNGCAGR